MSLDTNANIELKNKKKFPETVAFLNKTKCGVGIVDQITDKYIVLPGLRKWSTRIF